MTIVINNHAALVVELESVTGMAMTLDNLKKHDSRRQSSCTCLTFALYSSLELIVGLDAKRLD